MMERMTRKSKSINSYVLKDPSAIGCMNAVDKLGNYEDLEELIGIPLKNLAEICNNKIPEECKNPKKAIVLTDEDVDRWNNYKDLEDYADRLHKIAFHTGYNKAIDDFVKFASNMPTVETEDGEIRPMWLEEIAEQLKAGVEDD